MKRNTPMAHILRHAFLAILLLLALQPALAQSNTAWEEEEDEDETEGVVDQGPIEVKPDVAKYDDALIRLNGEVVKVSAEQHIKRNDTLDISVRQLAPGSAVIIEVQKGGINFKRKVFYANHQGELDLEVHTGAKKISGDAVLYYTPKGNAKKTIEVKIIIE